MGGSKSKGFTLIELLAVIVILAIVALISVPLVMGIIEKAKYSSYKASLNSIFKAGDIYEAINGFVDFPEEGVSVTDSDLPLKNNQFVSGKIIQNINGELELQNVYNGKYCANGPIENIVITEGSCVTLYTITTNSTVSNITSIGATISGEVIDDGLGTISERGIVYSLNQSPTISDTKLVVSGTTGTFSGDLTGLTKETTYYARTYNISDAGTSYGEEVSFTTLFGGIDEYTKLMLHMDGTDNGTLFTDETGKTVTKYGGAVTSAVKAKFGGSSLYFPNTSTSYLTLLDSTDWQFGTGNFTVDFWVNFNSIRNGENGFLGRYDSNAGSYTFEYVISGGIGYFRGYYDPYTILFSIQTNSNLNVDTWYHIAFVRKDTNVMQVFVNGVSQGTSSLYNTTMNGRSIPLVIGNYKADSTGGYLDGYMDEVRISKGVARWTSDFTPPSTPYTP